MSPLLALILIPIVGALFILAGGNPRKWAVWAAAFNFVGSVALFAMAKDPGAGYQFVSTFPIVPALHINFTLGADGLSLWMLFLSTSVTLAAVCLARTPASNAHWFYTGILFISAGAVGAFASLDVFFFYMFHELALIPTFLLIGIWGSGDRYAAAWKVTIYLTFGSFVLLLGLIGLYLSVPPEQMKAFDMRELWRLYATHSFQPGPAVYLLLVFGFGILVSLFPFHTWAPQGYASAPAPVAMLHSGVLKKFGLYGIMRLVTPLFPPEIAGPFNTLLVTLVLCNILYVGLVTIAQRKLDYMIGYSSVMHMGYIFLGLLSWRLIGATGAAVMLVAHGIAVAALFGLSGELRERTGTLDFSELGGLARAMPAFGLIFGFAAMGPVGLPGYSNFVGELMVFFGSFTGGTPNPTGYPNLFQIAAVCTVFGVVISAIFMLRAYRTVFMGPLPERWKNLADIAPLPKLCIAGLVAVLLVTGFFPWLIISCVEPALKHMAPTLLLP